VKDFGWIQVLAAAVVPQSQIVKETAPSFLCATGPLFAILLALLAQVQMTTNALPAQILLKSSSQMAEHQADDAWKNAQTTNTAILRETASLLTALSSMTAVEMESVMSKNGNSFVNVILATLARIARSS